MKVAIAAVGDGWEEKVDTRFGRAKGFFIIDTENNQTKFLDNSKNVITEHGAGTSTAQIIVEAGVNTILTCKVGPKAGSVLKATGIKTLTVNENATIKEAYNRYKKNELSEQSL